MSCSQWLISEHRSCLAERSPAVRTRGSLACTSSRAAAALADEPTVGVTHAFARHSGILRQADRGRQTVLITTHLMDEAEKCQRVAMCVLEIRLGALKSYACWAAAHSQVAGRAERDVALPRRGP